MKLDSTTLRLIRAASQAVADECTLLIDGYPAVAAFPVPATPEVTPEPAQLVAPTPSKRTRGKATAPAEPVVVTDTPPVTNVEQPAAPAPAAPAPAAPAPAAPAPTTTLPPQSTVTDQELAALADVLKNDPEKLRLYQAWRDASDFHGGVNTAEAGAPPAWVADGTTISGKGLSLSKIPNVGDNRDRLLEALKRALV